jgi:Fe2+ transport system protein FeoA
VTLDTSPHGMSARVISVAGEGAVSLRLMQMGVVPGVAIRVVKSAPLGDPIQVRVRDYDLLLRRLDAQRITVRIDSE